MTPGQPNLIAANGKTEPWNRWSLVVAAVLALGYLLRLIPSWCSLYLIRPDEVQYWEMAHRLVYGDGCLAWEYRVGARSWLYVLPMAFPLWVLKGIGVVRPEWYIPLVKSFLAFLSMAIPLGMWRLGKVLYDEATAFVALLLGCFWYELVLAANHGLTEYFAVGFCFAALALLRDQVGGGRAFVMGLLLGMSLAFRSHNAVPIILLVSLLLPRFSPRSRGALLLGGGLSAAVAVVTDWVTWGRPAHSFLLYGASILSQNELHGLNPRWQHLLNLTLCSRGLLVVVLLYGILHLKRHRVTAGVAAVTILFFSLQGAQEYSYLFLAIPFLLCLLAFILIHAVRGWGRGLLAAFVLYVSLLGLLGRLPPRFVFQETGGTLIRANGAFHRDPWLETGLELSRMEPGSVLWGCGDAVAPGGYYVFHHHRQLFFPLGVPAHAALLKGRYPRDFARYCVLLQGAEPLPGFHLKASAHGFDIHENDTVPEQQEVEGYACDLQLPDDRKTLELLLEKKLIGRIPDPVPWNSGNP